MEYKRSEITAGVFLLVSFAVLVVMVFAVTDVQSLFVAKKEIKAVFPYSDGIEENAQVRLMGIKIGKVTAVRAAPELGGKVELTLRVRQDANIKDDTKAAIQTLGLVGGKYVELSGGSPDAKPLPPDGVLIGETSLKLDDLTKAGLEVAQKLMHIADNLEGLLGDPALTKSIKETVRNLQEVSANVRTMTANKAEIAQGLKNLPEILKKLDATMGNLQAITTKSDAMVGENRKNIDATLTSVRETMKNVKELTDDLKAHPWKLIRKP